MKAANTSKVNNIVSGVLDSLKNNETERESKKIDDKSDDGQACVIKGDLIRIDKNIAKNVDILTDNQDKLKGLSNEDKNLIKNIIYFLCLKRQNDIFGFGRLDPYEFARDFGYNPKSFWRKHPDPVQLNGLNNDEKERLYELQQQDFKHHIYDSVFENALYWLHTNVLQFKRGGKDVVINNETVSFVESKSYVLLPEISIFMRNEGKNKYFYTYTVDNKFIENLSLYYLNCNRQSLIALRKSSTDDLYVFLSNVRASIVEELRNSKASAYNGSINFEFLCNVAQISRFTKTDIEGNESVKEIPAKKRKQLLINALRRINDETECKFEVTWKKKTATDRWAYLPVFDFKIEEKEKISHTDNQVKIEEKADIFRQNLGHDLWELFKRVSVEREESDFFKWLRDSEKQLKEKDMVYRNANFKTYGKLYKYIDAQTAAWLKKLPKIQSIDQITG
ncbi:MAG: hypothetical protein LBV74_17175 [Tannerella sp.]|jgi:gamma-glutamylcyclotransferase (GGCT)/AIG2-like uncharacterized protein YtfP|nr:hypothetical protein [Tannerella sp.]